jgi:hypothetical protein
MKNILVLLAPYLTSFSAGLFVFILGKIVERFEKKKEKQEEKVDKIAELEKGKTEIELSNLEEKLLETLLKELSKEQKSNLELSEKISKLEQQNRK